MSLSTPDHDTILEEIRRWPRDAQLALAREILQAAYTPVSSAIALETTQIHGLANLIGLFATEATAPSDDDIERWREEWRMEKYGQ